MLNCFFCKEKSKISEALTALITTSNPFKSELISENISFWMVKFAQLISALRTIAVVSNPLSWASFTSKCPAFPLAQITAIFIKTSILLKVVILYKPHTFSRKSKKESWLPLLLHSRRVLLCHSCHFFHFRSWLKIWIWFKRNLLLSASCEQNCKHHQCRNC